MALITSDSGPIDYPQRNGPDHLGFSSDWLCSRYIDPFIRVKIVNDAGIVVGKEQATPGASDSPCSTKYGLASTKLARTTSDPPVCREAASHPLSPVLLLCFDLLAVLSRLSPLTTAAGGASLASVWEMGEERGERGEERE